MTLPKLIIGVVTDGRTEMTVQCCVSILNLQTELMKTSMTPGGPPFQADLRFFKTNNEAVEDLYKDKEFSALFLINFSMGVNGRFAIKAFESPNDVVIGVHPMPTIDWDRVREKITSTTESVQHAGIVYNVSLNGSPDSDGFVTIGKDVQKIDVMFLRRTVIDDIVANHPSIVSNDGGRLSLLLDGLYDGTFMTGEQRFVSLYDKPMYTDTAFQCNKAAPADYVGIVGNRARLR